MFLLLFFVLLIQVFIFWIFEPLASFLEYVLEIKKLPVIALISLILLFSAKQVKRWLWPGAKSWTVHIR